MKFLAGVSVVALALGCAGAPPALAGGQGGGGSGCSMAGNAGSQTTGGGGGGLGDAVNCGDSNGGTGGGAQGTAGSGTGGGAGGAAGVVETGAATLSASVTGGNGGQGLPNTSLLGSGGGGGGAGVATNYALTIASGVTVTGGAGGVGALNGTQSGGGGGDGGGGAGVVTSGSLTVDSGAAVTGGAGGILSFAPGGGGTGVALTGGTAFTFINDGMVTGGSGGFGDTTDGGGGAGVDTSSNVINNGTITGSGDNSQGGGGGGAGIVAQSAVADGLTITNTGNIVGGSAGKDSTGNGSSSGAGEGGANGISSNGGISQAGAGIIGEGLNVVNSGLISGGAGLTSQYRADAIDFIDGANSLTLEAGYSFVGNVIASRAGADVLTLGGANNATFNMSNIAAADPGSYNGTPVYAGFANYQKTGASTWTLTGKTAISTTTNWTVAGGTLQVGASAGDGTVLNGAVTVDNGATLDGYGQISGAVTNSGTVLPGDAIGRLTVDGNYTQNANGTLNIEITPNATPGTGYDQLVVPNGLVNLAGTLNVTVDAGNYITGTVYDIITTNYGVSGSFSRIAYNPAFAAYITPVVGYGATTVTLTLTPTVAPNAPPGATPVLFSSGRIYEASSYAENGAMWDALGAPLVTGPASGDAVDDGYWLHGVGAFGNANGYDFNEKGFVLGKGFDVSPGLVVGAALSNIYTSTSGGGDSATGSTVGGLLYGIYTANRLSLAGDATVGHVGERLVRSLPTLGLQAKAASNGIYAGAGLRMQYALLSQGGYFLSPYAAVSYLHTHTGSAQETGAGLLNLYYGAMHGSLGQAGAGVTGGYAMPVRYGMLTIWASLGGGGTLGNPYARSTEVSGSFSHGVTALAAPVGDFSPAVGVELASAGRWRLGAGWSGQFAGPASAETFNANADYRW